MGKVSDAVYKLAVPIAESLGLEVVEVLYEKQRYGMVLTIVIDKEGGVTLNDCEKMHNAVDGPLDELDPIETSYTLNVSSPGLDRPLKTERDYRRNLNKRITVRLYKPADGKKVFNGVLRAFDEDTFTIESEKGEQITFYKKDTAKVEPIIEF